MLTVYVSPSCSSCRKVKDWLNEHKIEFKEKNIFSAVLNESELKEMLAKTENGTEDITSTRSNAFKNLNKDIDDFTIRELIAFIQNNPSVLKRPIIVSDRLVQVGYNEEEIRTFIPPEARRIARLACSRGECPNFETCAHVLDSKEE